MCFLRSSATVKSMLVSGVSLVLVAAGPVWGQLGVPVTAPAALNTNAGSDSGDDRDPQVATDGAGNWVVVWDSKENLGGTIGSDDDIFVSRSTDGGATWSAPAPLNTNANSDSGGDFEPQVSTDGAGNWVAVWDSGDDLGGTIGADGDSLVSRSSDNGANWSAPAALNANAGSDSGDDYYPQISTDGAGNWVAVWRSSENLGGTIGTDQDIFVSRSTNDGAIWSAPAVLNTNADSDSGDDYYPQLTTDGAGNWVAVWDSYDDLGGTIGTDADILVSRSSDNGASWSAPAALNSSADSDGGNDRDPQVATDGVGNWVAVWYSNEDLGATIGTDQDIFISRSTDQGANWSAPAALNTNADSDSGGDYDPQVTTDGAGNWVVVWYSNEDLGGAIGGDNDILVSHSSNNGATWSAPAALNTNADSDSGSDYNPEVTTDGAGNWVVVWYSSDDLGGTIATDYDILVARFTLPDCNGNGVGDGQDIADGTSEDCNGDGVPDECESDTDGDGIIDDCDNCPEVANQDQVDRNNDGIGDACAPGCCGAAGPVAPLGLTIGMLLFRCHARYGGRIRRV